MKSFAVLHSKPLSYIQLLWLSRKRFCKEGLPIPSNAQQSRLVGWEFFNFSEVHVHMILGIFIRGNPPNIQSSHIFWHCRRTHDNGWWLVGSLIFRFNGKRGGYLCPCTVIIGIPEAIINVIFIPEYKISSEFIQSEHFKLNEFITKEKTDLYVTLVIVPASYCVKSAKDPI